MLEGLPPNNAAHRMRLVCDETQARAIADLIVEMFDPADAAASAFELEENTQDWKSGDWIVEAYFGDPPDEDYVRSLVETVAGADAAKAVVFSLIEQRDWIAASLEGLAPVRAGRFLVHGSHDRGKAAPNDIALEIEAALAFGTGHHGTTRGCLLMLDWVLKRRRPKDILDVGTGTGVLALAAARALRQPIMAGDIDPIAVEATKANAVLNGARPWVEAFTARGVLHPSLRMSGPYDLIFANILARPLRQMAPDIAAVATDNAEIILSGLLSRDVPGVLSSYGAQGFALVRRIDLEGWATLLMRIGGPKPTKRPFVRKAHWPP
ncbi:MAG: ribosomal protein L11 methyltransferase [Rhizobiales bacterium 62-17]|nr:50S ribosomal protein L11 methyltransferase [Hyphomicrobiales bacterium]OJY03051.1 MAG: ribosomal protein L11 methyltransferase [Rhizobiales bacterium 62-17]